MPIKFFKKKSLNNLISRISALRALRHKNFSLFISGQSLSVVGTWVQRIALTWLVYRISNSALLLGVVGFSGQIPLLLITPFAGVLADRLNKHKILLFTQSLAMIQAFILAFLVLTNIIQIWEIILLSIILGIINAIDMPTRQSFMIDMVGNNRDDLGNAVAMNSSIVNAARLVGPAVAGILISAFGEGWCFLLNAISYIAVIISLLRMEIVPKKLPVKKSSTIVELKEGFNYAFKFAPIKSILLLLALVSLMGTPIRILAPVFVKNVFHGGADLYGFLMGSSGLGALIGAFFLMNRKNILGLGNLIAYSAIAFSMGILGFAFSPFFILSGLFMLITGFGRMIELAGSNTLLQTIVDDNKRGRIMSLYAMSFRGIVPFGSLLSGALAGLIGATYTLSIAGIFCLAGSVYFLHKLPQMRELMRPIYQKLGILPNTSVGVNTASQLSYQEKE